MKLGNPDFSGSGILNTLCLVRIADILTLDIGLGHFSPGHFGLGRFGSGHFGLVPFAIITLKSRFKAGLLFHKVKHAHMRNLHVI